MFNSMKFQNLGCWQRARKLAVDIYKITMKGKLDVDFCFRDQLRRSAVSIASNIAEGKERGTAPEFVRFLCIAKASAAELITLLSIAKDIGYINKKDFQDLERRIMEISYMIGGLIKSIKQRQ